jgi:hypothetical protein
MNKDYEDYLLLWEKIFGYKNLSSAFEDYPPERWKSLLEDLQSYEDVLVEKEE